MNHPATYFQAAYQIQQEGKKQCLGGRSRIHLDVSYFFFLLLVPITSILKTRQGKESEEIGVTDVI